MDAYMYMREREGEKEREGEGKAKKAPCDGAWSGRNACFSVSPFYQDSGLICKSIQCIFQAMGPGFEPWSAMCDLAPSAKCLNT